MRMFIGKQILRIVLIAILLFTLLPLNQHAAETTAEDNAARNRSAASGKLQLATSSGPVTEVPTRWDIYEIIFGTLLLLVGFTLILLALLRRQASDLTLISFGLLCFLYGARTRAFQFLFSIPPFFWSYTHWFITYLVPIAGWIFAEQFLGKGWKSSIKRLLQIQIIFSICAIAVGLYLRQPAAAEVANNIMAGIGMLVILANLFQPQLAPNRELKVLRIGCLIFVILGLVENVAPLFTNSLRDLILEEMGFVFFICCLVYVVAYRFFKNEKKLITISHELETARQIQSFILPGETIHIKGLSLAARYVPMASVAGDFYDFIKVDEKHLGVLVADVSGHGVPASNASHAANPAEVLDGINRVLCGKLENDFVTAGYLFVDTEKNSMVYAGAGHMPLLLWRPAEKKIFELGEKATILVQFEDIQLQNVGFALRPDDRIILYTDGIIEASDTAHALFGLDRFKEFIKSHAALPAGQFADALIRQLFDWSGKPSAEALDVADYQHV